MGSARSTVSTVVAQSLRPETASLILPVRTGLTPSRARPAPVVLAEARRRERASVAMTLGPEAARLRPEHQKFVWFAPLASLPCDELYRLAKQSPYCEPFAAGP